MAGFDAGRSQTSDKLISEAQTFPRWPKPRRFKTAGLSSTDERLASVLAILLARMQRARGDEAFRAR
jgi:hypothetical protein